MAIYIHIHIYLLSWSFEPMLWTDHACTMLLVALMLTGTHGDLLCVPEAPAAANRKRVGDNIVIHRAAAADRAVYQCHASNRHGSLLANANIMIMSESRTHTHTHTHTRTVGWRLCVSSS